MFQCPFALCQDLHELQRYRDMQRDLKVLQMVQMSFSFFVFVIFVCVWVSHGVTDLCSARKGMMKMTQARVGMRWNLRVSHLSESSKYHPKIQDHWTARMESIDVNRTYWSYCAILRHVCVRLADATVINSQVCFPVTVFRIRPGSTASREREATSLFFERVF